MWLNEDLRRMYQSFQKKNIQVLTQLTASLSITCFLFILLSPDLSFFTEATLDLAVLGILIPRDLAALSCFSF